MMNVKTYFLLLLCASLINACGDSFNTHTDKSSPSKKSPTPSPLPPDPTPKPEDPPVTKDSIQACYFDSQASSEVCIDVEEASAELSQSDYLYKDPSTASNFPSHFSLQQYLSPLRFIVLANVATDLKLTKNFQVGELMQSTKGALGLFSPDVLSYIQDMRTQIQKAMHIHSAFRGPAHNTRIGGATWSRHMYGDAIDFHVKNVSFTDLATYCLDFGATFYQIYATHIHCDWRNTPLNESFYDRPTIVQSDFVNYQKMAQQQSSILITETKNHWQLTVKSRFIEDDA
ncbi:MAG: DUF882 domain-containing protein, partial [Bdellovibrionales bacterium]|nr:DUF882 domain-containing protein [Bdellovibrionales bacterium]